MNKEWSQFTNYTDATAEGGLHEWGSQQVEDSGGQMIRDIERESVVLEENDPTLRAYHERVNDVREKIAMVDKNDPMQCEQYTELCHTLAETQANYAGDWTLLELRRALDQKTHEKYINLIDTTEGFKEGAGGFFDKEGQYKATFEPLYNSDVYTKHVADVFLNTHVASASEHSKLPESLGVGGYGKSGTVFTDAVMKEQMTDEQGEKKSMVTLNERQKNIIEAHEKVHGIFSFNDSPMGLALREALDNDVLAELQKTQRTTYMREPDEILARMSQLRNYFGMGAGEEFTSEHLALARERYVADTKLDNVMHPFLSCITEKTQDKFIQAMNRFPM
ncbi:MAG: hypothetical protein KBD21_03595 [Candidatus Pacebacteria bacterium]|nr:hypothetical protein [Candidatus Paceibacterota bacterium]